MAWNQPGVILFSLRTQDKEHGASPVQLSCLRAWLAPCLQRAEPLDGSPEAAHTAAVVNEVSDCIRQVGCNASTACCCSCCDAACHACA